MEQHFWLFGEQYNLASADKRMKDALEQYLNILYGEKTTATLKLDAENERRMDIFLCNSRNVDREEELLRAFSKELNSQLIYFVPRDNIVQRAEIHRQTVIQYDPNSRQAGEYRNLAEAIENNTFFTVPTPMTQDRLPKVYDVVIGDGSRKLC